MITPNIDTKALRELEAKATPGDWTWVASPEGVDQLAYLTGIYLNTVSSGRVHGVAVPDGDKPLEEYGVFAAITGNGPTGGANAELIVALRNAAPALLDAAEERDSALQAIADLQAHVARAEDELHDRERERALTREALGFKCRTPEEDMGCGCLMIPTCDRAREVVAERDALKAEVERLREALTPSGATKAAYIGEFKFDHVYDLHADSVEVVIPWTTIKDIMAAISKRAALRSEKGEVQS